MKLAVILCLGALTLLLISQAREAPPPIAPDAFIAGNLTQKDDPTDHRACINLSVNALF